MVLGAAEIRIGSNDQIGCAHLAEWLVAASRFNKKMSKQRHISNNCVDKNPGKIIKRKSSFLKTKVRSSLSLKCILYQFIIPSTIVLF